MSKMFHARKLAVIGAVEREILMGRFSVIDLWTIMNIFVLFLVPYFSRYYAKSVQISCVFAGAKCHL
ncbi:hypothetical protein T12_6697 [Trichinella patagoniensis]|uniref:Uncharacterized protein n=1 Tax=Trichinella patagoniensis TaxID=990121 RepID=A0A0V0YZS5_9BILA|nr:hypothetical protein T12_6697 [Trichinella patagoniensis]